MKNFKLWMGCLGNGITVCNSAVESNGEYKYIAHISNNGKISKLHIKRLDNNKIVCNYDRGFDVQPKKKSNHSIMR